MRHSEMTEGMFSASTMNAKGPIVRMDETRRAKNEMSV